MQVNELRIGNLINGKYTVEDYNEKDDIIEIISETLCEVLSIDSTGQSDFPIYVKSDSSIEYFDSFQPIPLTEEWLIKFGFESNEDFVSEDNPWNDYVKLSLRITMPYFDFIFNDGESNTQIQYVHQLQNLYFALTQTELTIK